MAIKTPAPATSASFDDYVRCLRAEVDAAAKVRWEDPVAFLWRARRVGEALLHALRVRHVPGSGHELSASIDGLLKHELLRAKLGRENLIDLQGLQSLGNTGSHIQGEAINYEHTAGVAAAHLANVVAWFFRAQHPEAAVPEDVGHALDILRDPARWRSSPDNLARRAAERIDQLTGELRRASEVARSTDIASDGDATTPPRLSPWRAVIAALGVALPAFGGGLAAGRGCGNGGEQGPVALVRPTPTVPDGGIAGNYRDVPTVVEAVADRDAGSARCPDGTVEIEARSFQLLPPPGNRTAIWQSRQPGQPTSVTVARACLDARVATVGEVRTPGSTLSDVFHGCIRPPPGRDEPMPCLNYEEAAAWCRSRHGRLPRLLEWEALSRQQPVDSPTYVDPPPRRDGDLFEWTEDAFPPAVFHLAAHPVSGWFVTRKIVRSPPSDGPADPRHSWNRQMGIGRVHSLYVRCAFDPPVPPR